MDAAWAGNTLKAKFAINSLIGIFSLDSQISYQHSTSSVKEDAPSGSLVSEINLDGQRYYDFVTGISMKTSFSYRPIYDLALCSEAARMGQALYILKCCRAIPFEINTDSILFQQKKRTPIDFTNYDIAIYIG